MFCFPCRSPFFVKFIPKYCILFDAIQIISFSDCSLIMYRNGIDFCILILNSATLLNSFIVSNCLGGGFLWILYIQNHVITNGDSFISSIPFAYFSYLIILARAPSTILNRGRESNLYPWSWENTQSFTNKYDVSYRVCVDTICHVEEIPLYW